MEHSNISWNLTEHSVVENQLLFLQSNSEESVFVTTLCERKLKLNDELRNYALGINQSKGPKDEAPVE